MNEVLKNAMAVIGVTIASQAGAQVTFYEHEGFVGRSFSTEQAVNNFKSQGFNDRASSVVVVRDRWEVCEDTELRGRCIVLRPGHYPSLTAMGMNDRISSVRDVSRSSHIGDNRYAPAPPAPAYFYRRDDERLFEANVTSVRAVLGPPVQRCWIEQEQVAQERGKANVPGAIAGAILGGILGHQIGGGRGQDIVTAGGAVAGAAVGANVGRDGGSQPTQMRDVQRCASTPNQDKPEFWDVSYTFRGMEHRIQMTSPPGPTVTVNEQGAPRE